LGGEARSPLRPNLRTAPRIRGIYDPRIHKWREDGATAASRHPRVGGKVTSRGSLSVEIPLRPAKLGLQVGVLISCIAFCDEIGPHGSVPIALLTPSFGVGVLVDVEELPASTLRLVGDRGALRLLLGCCGRSLRTTSNVEALPRLVAVTGRVVASAVGYARHRLDAEVRVVPGGVARDGGGCDIDIDSVIAVLGGDVLTDHGVGGQRPDDDPLVAGGPCSVGKLISIVGSSYFSPLSGRAGGKASPQVRSSWRRNGNRPARATASLGPPRSFERADVARWRRGSSRRSS
jgi:hypothetical protein